MVEYLRVFNHAGFFSLSVATRMECLPTKIGDRVAVTYESDKADRPAKTFTVEKAVVSNNFRPV